MRLQRRSIWAGERRGSISSDCRCTICRDKSGVLLRDTTYEAVFVISFLFGELVSSTKAVEQHIAKSAKLGVSARLASKNIFVRGREHLRAKTRTGYGDLQKEVAKELGRIDKLRAAARAAGDAAIALDEEAALADGLGVGLDANGVEALMASV